MRKILIFFILFSLSLFGLELKIASYNVENLFDLKYDKSEYKEYIPNNKSNWNQKSYKIKLENTARVINELNADIVALQEIESQQALTDLLKYLPQYKYYSFIKNKKAAVGLAMLSRYPIKDATTIKFKTKVNRPIQKVIVLVNHHELTLYNNHWASKRNKESHRVNFALELQKEIKRLPLNADYILLGDFNSNYNEYETLKFDKKLNDTNGYTGINHVLNTVVNHQIISKQNIHQQSVPSHYNLWYELKTNERFSNQYKNQKNTPDNILLSQGLFDTKNFSYINNSFKVFKADYLFKKNKIYRWKLSKDKIHQQKGFSDHLPIYAKFNLKKYERLNSKVISTIKDLYHIEELTHPLHLDNIMVIYKHKNHALIKQKNGRAIFVYNSAKNLEEGSTYNLTLNQLKTYQGLKEITQISNIDKVPTKITPTNYYIDATTINLQQMKNQNEVITNLSGIYKKGYIYYENNKKIKLYSKNKSLLPKNGQNITIISGHLGYYKNQAQIIIYKKSDIKVNL